MKTYEIDSLRMVILNKDGEEMVTHQKMMEMGREKTDLMFQRWGLGPVELTGLNDLVVMTKPAAMGKTDCSIELPMTKEMMMSRGKMKTAVTGKPDRSGQRAKVTPPPMFAAPGEGRTFKAIDMARALASGRPIHAPRNMMQGALTTPESAPMTRAARRRAAKMEKKP